MQFQKIYTDNYSGHGRLLVILRRWEVTNAKMFFLNENMMLTKNSGRQLGRIQESFYGREGYSTRVFPTLICKCSQITERGVFFE